MSAQPSQKVIEQTEAFQRHRAELDPFLEAHPSPVGKVAAALTIAALIAAVIGSGPLAAWAFNLPLWLGGVREAAVAVTSAWDGAMIDIGMSEVYTFIHDAFHDLRCIGSENIDCIGR